MKEFWFMGHNDYINLLYLPYTAIVFSFIIDGMVLSGVPDIMSDILLLVAYFFGLGISAHYLNEAYSHRLMDRGRASVLKIIGTASLIVAAGLGGYLVVTLSNVPLMIIGIIEVLAVILYNHPRFNAAHNDFFFSVAWGGLPSLAGFMLGHEVITVSALALFAVTSILGSLEITPSRHVKYWRRRDADIEKVLFKDGKEMQSSVELMIKRPERSIKLLSVLCYIMPVLLYLVIYSRLTI
ncbi:MAG: hypothetical protein JRN37_00875 [Nitrososphaerota archaeon]|nr:hypothetical protein [Nitrososphaerota archaeon]MDG7037705.1 hypothetical protein [Nitrososphaerota archaeon]MDG7043204.1 hypothetical protein [Nitrososphaerota archaeon]